MKNMKLTNLSLAVLVALGLVACGGSDNKDNAPVDKKPDTGHTDAGGNDQNNNNNQPQKPTDGKDVVKKPTNEKTGVEGRFKNDVNVNFKTYANRSGQDTLAGYLVPDNAGQSMAYEDGSTSVKDIKRASSIVNYLQARWVNSSGDQTNVPSSIRLNPLQTYALGDNGVYYRVKEPTTKNWDSALATDTFTVVSAGNGQFTSVGGNTNIPASRLFYIPNVMTGTSSTEAAATDAYVPSSPTELAKLGRLALSANAAQTAGVNVVRASSVSYSSTPNQGTNVFDIRRHDVKYEYVKVGGKKQEINATNGSNNHYLLDLGTVPKGELTKKPIELGYGIHDNKSTFDGRDDDIYHKETKAGELRIYDVSYSRALLEVNQAARDNSDAPNAEARNGLGFAGTARRATITDFGNVSGSGRNGSYGPFQVMGSTTGTIPVNGRAHYLGKSFGVNSIGDIDLEADFGVDRASIGGVIENRTNMKGDVSLPDMNLEKIILSQPGSRLRDASMGLDSTSTVQNAAVHLGGEKNWGTWAVRFYGPNALSAAGVIAQGSQPTGGDNNSPLNNVVEVFNAERGDLLPESLNN